MIQKVLALISGNYAIRVFLQKCYVWISQHIVLLPPLGIAIEMTYACNWRCRMCFHHRPEIHGKMAATIQSRRKDELTTSELKTLIDDLIRSGVRHVSLHGGEPLIRPDFAEIVTYAANQKLHTSTFTNATLITDEIARVMVDNLHDLGTSIHGNETVHDQVTGVPGSFRQALDGLLRLQSAKRAAKSATPHINLACIVTAINYRHLAELVDVVKQLGLDHFGFGIVTTTSPAAVDATRRMLGFKVCSSPFLGDALLDPELLNVNAAEYRNEIEKAGRLAGKHGIRVSSYPFNSDSAITQAFSDPLFRLGKRCHYPWFSSVISTYGDVYPCIQFSFLGEGFGNIRTSSFRTIWRSPAYRSFRATFLRRGCYSPVCAKCCSIIDES